MTTFWERAQQLKGDTLHTFTHSKPFDIVDVTPDRIIFVPQAGTGTHRWVSREQIETMCSIAQASGNINRVLVQEQYLDDRNTSYIAAIVQIVLSR